MILTKLSGTSETTNPYLLLKQQPDGIFTIKGRKYLYYLTESGKKRRYDRYVYSNCIGILPRGFEPYFRNGNTLDPRPDNLGKIEVSIANILRVQERKHDLTNLEAHFLTTAQSIYR